MSTKRELVDLARALGKRLGIEVDVERKNHQALSELVEELRVRVQSGGAADTARDDDDVERDEDEDPTQVPRRDDGDRHDTAPEVSANVSAGSIGGVRRALGLRGSEFAPPPAAALAAVPVFTIEELQPGETIEPPSLYPTDEPPAASVAPRRAAKPTANRVAPSKVLTTQRGYLRAGDVVTAGDLAGGQRTIDLLVAKGVIETQ